MKRACKTSWNYRTQERGKFLSVITKYYDEEQASAIDIQAGNGEPAYVMRQKFKDKEAAWQAATAKLNAIERGQATLSINISGRMDIMAEGKINLPDIRNGINGNYIINKVRHSLDNGGFKTNFGAEFKA